ncbi:MAG: response regulator transcription factor [Daejeonella sp.]
MIRILIADDHAVVRKGIIQIIKDDFPASFLQEAVTGEQLVKMALAEEWDLIISDISMPGRSGMDALLQIKNVKPNQPVLILSMHPEDQYAIRVLKAGASGYLNKDSASDDLVKAIHTILEGKRYITSGTANEMVSKLHQPSNVILHQILSDREFEIMKLIAKGVATSVIAANLSLSISTVSTYRARILNKMNVNSNAALTLYAIEHNL